MINNKRKTSELFKRKITSELFKKYFSFQRPIEMLKAVYTTKNRRKKEKLVNVIKSILSDLMMSLKLKSQIRQ